MFASFVPSSRRLVLACIHQFMPSGLCFLGLVQAGTVYVRNFLAEAGARWLVGVFATWDGGGYEVHPSAFESRQVLPWMLHVSSVKPADSEANSTNCGRTRPNLEQTRQNSAEVNQFGQEFAQIRGNSDDSWGSDQSQAKSTKTGAISTNFRQRRPILKRFGLNLRSLGQACPSLGLATCRTKVAPPNNCSSGSRLKL